MSLPNYDAAIITALKAAGGVTALVSQRIYNMQAPTGTTLPLVLVYPASNVSPNFTSVQEINAIYRIEVRVSGVSPASAIAIQSAIHTALHLQALTVTGWSNFWTACENSDKQFIENAADGNPYTRRIADYRIRASKD
jgi:hypothetical protein